MGSILCPNIYGYETYLVLKDSLVPRLILIGEQFGEIDGSAQGPECGAIFCPLSYN